MPDSGEPKQAAIAWLELPGKQTFVLKGDCHIGRIAGNEIVNPDSRISRRNSIVQRLGNHYVLVDLGSTNGTYLNDHRIYKPTRLKDRDVITVGSERYTFRQPPESSEPSTDPAISMLNRTAVAVGMVSCWMLRAAAPEASGAPAAAWTEALRESLVAKGAGMRRLPESVLFAHWRDGKTGPESARSVILGLAGRPRPVGAVIVVHHGAVRVGPAPAPGEESLLGVEVSFTHKLAATAARMSVGVLLSEAAVHTLALLPAVKALGSHTVGDGQGKHALYALDETAGP